MKSLHSRATIEQRYELETTVVGLGLASTLEVPIGLNDRFVLREQLGRGSMGLVYLADDEALRRKVAIKVVARRSGRQRLEQRLRREAQALAALDHPHVVKVFDIGVDGDELFIAMEHVAGADLRKWQTHPGRTRAEILDAYVQAGRGLAAAHASKLVHRDFKPDNVFVEEIVADGEKRIRVRVGDFGLAGEDLDENATSEPAVGTQGSLTSSRTLLGTPSYMAPEQLRRERADARSDQHQFCVALWEALVGQRPFGPGARRIEGGTAVPTRPPALPRAVYRILQRGLAFDPEARHPGMDALLDALERYRRGPRIRRWATAIGAAGAFLGTMAVTLALAWPRWPSTCDTPGELMDRVFDAEKAHAIQAVLAPMDAESGGDVAGYVVGNLQRAKAQWVEATTLACEARQRGTLDLARLERREQCLDRWAEQIESRAARILLPGGVAIASELVAPLGYVGFSCEMPPAPIDRSIELAITRAEDAGVSLELQHALELANAAVLLAREAPMCPSADPNGPLRSSELAAAYYELGRAQAEFGASKAALESLDLAHVHASACADRHRDADARIYAAKVLATDLGHVSDAERSLEEANAALWQVREPTISLRRYEERMAASLVAVRKQGSYESARLFAEEARQALGEHDDPILHAKLLLNIGVALQQKSHYAEANTAYQDAISLLDEHPALAQLYSERRALNLGLAAVKANDLKAIRLYLGTASKSSDPTIKVKALSAFAQGEYLAEDREAAAAKVDELLAFLREEPVLSPVTRATAETTAGQVLVALEDPKGLELLEQVCPRWRDLHGAQEATCQISRAWALYDLGRFSEARRVVERIRSLDVSPEIAKELDDIESKIDAAAQPPASPPHENEEGP